MAGPPVPVMHLYDLALGDGMFVAVGGEGTQAVQANHILDVDVSRAIYASADGIAWERVYSGAVGELWHVAAGNGRYLATTSRGSNPYDAVAFASDDALDWKALDMPGSGGEVVFGNGMFVALDRWKHCFYTSAYAETWETVPWPECSFFNSLSFGAGKFVATCGSAIYVSDTGADWQAVSYDGWSITRVIDLDDQLIALTMNPACPEGAIESGFAASPDGLTWSVIQPINYNAPVTLPIWVGSAGCVGLRNHGNGELKLVSGAACDDMAATLASPSTLLATPDALLTGGGWLIRTDDGLNWSKVLSPE